MSQTLSVVISTFNSGRFLENCLSSAKTIADEIIVVDHESTDDSITIAKQFTKKIYHKKNNPQHIDIQKNFGFEKATSDWILSLDADEEITKDLAIEIKEILSQDTNVQGYMIPRKNFIFNKWIEHTGWYPDYQLRLFRKGKGKFVKEHVHEHITVEGKIEKMNSPMIHQNYQTIYQFLHRNLTIYGPNEAKYLHDNGYVFSYADIMRFPFNEFLSRFFAREGYKDGFHGIVLSLLMAFYHFCIFLYLWEYEKFPSDTDKKIFVKELKDAEKELRYWIATQSIQNSKSSAKKILFKAKRKFGL